MPDGNFITKRFREYHPMLTPVSRSDIFFMVMYALFVGVDFGTGDWHVGGHELILMIFVGLLIVSQHQKVIMKELYEEQLQLTYKKGAMDVLEILDKTLTVAIEDELLKRNPQ